MVIQLVQNLPKTPAGYAIANQLIRSGTSVGANISEAQSAFSKKEFIHSMQISLKEAQETNYWIELTMESKIIPLVNSDTLFQESVEVIKILTTIIKNAKLNL